MKNIINCNVRTNFFLYLERLVVGSFITITSAISPNFEKYSFNPSEKGNFLEDSKLGISKKSRLKYYDWKWIERGVLYWIESTLFINQFVHVKLNQLENANEMKLTYLEMIEVRKEKVELVTFLLSCSWWELSWLPASHHTLRLTVYWQKFHSLIGFK